MANLPSETAALVALLRWGSRPWHHYAQLVDEARSARTVLLSEFEPASLLDSVDEVLADAAADITGWALRGLRVVTVLDADYPPNLLTTYDLPPLLFVSGALSEADHRSICVIGSRRASELGMQLACSIARDIVAAGYTVVSGLAAGVDTAAHTAALAAGGRTVAVIGIGLPRSYPASNRALQQRIATECAVLSPFWPDTPPSRCTFPARNVVMSGLALGSVIVEASWSSGARQQARRALAHGRPVFLLERLLSQEWASELSRRPGVYVVQRADEVIATLDRLYFADALTA